eukprot:733880-Rhodomonas_salina.1
MQKYTSNSPTLTSSTRCTHILEKAMTFGIETIVNSNELFPQTRNPPGTGHYNTRATTQGRQGCNMTGSAYPLYGLRRLRAPRAFGAYSVTRGVDSRYLPGYCRDLTLYTLTELRRVTDSLAVF